MGPYPLPVNATGHALTATMRVHALNVWITAKRHTRMPMRYGRTEREDRRRFRDTRRRRPKRRRLMFITSFQCPKSRDLAALYQREI